MGHRALTIEDTLLLHSIELRRVRARLDLVILLLSVADHRQLIALTERLRANTSQLEAAVAANQPPSGDTHHAQSDAR